MIKKRMIAAALAAMVLGAGVVPARAEKLVYVSGPGGQYTTYTVPVLVIRAGDSVDYTNIDIPGHDVLARHTEPWYSGCAGNGAILPSPSDPDGSCPAFWTSVIGLGRTTPIVDIEDEAPGQYEFFCSLHAGMFGILVVL